MRMIFERIHLIAPHRARRKSKRGRSLLCVLRGAIGEWLGSEAGLFQGVLQQAPQGAKAVFPADFFSFFIGPSPVADAYLIHAQAPLGNLYGDLRLKTEAILFDGDDLENLAAENLVEIGRA